jgi:subfamily B ATP-binding cassette protein MsbA
MRLVATRAFGDVVTQFVVVAGFAVIVFFIFSGLLTEDVESDEFLAFLTALGILLTSLKRLVNSNATMQRGLAAGQSLFEVLDEPSESVVQEADGAGQAVSARRVAGTLALRDVSFRYGDDQTDVLHGLSFTLEPGQTLAIVGRSGSGKSTLVGLLPRFYEATGGAILLDAKDIRDYPLGTLRRQFSFVSQDVVIFDDTIAGNIAYGALARASREEIERAAETAYVSDFAAELPRGLDTEVGEGGALLSGGQRQRIAIARAVLKDAPVLILDEATSALDSESERQVQAALTELMRGRTTLVIAHRLSTVERADRIIVMRGGRIVEAGTHRELLAARGDYASLYQLQFAE